MGKGIICNALRAPWWMVAVMLALAALFAFFPQIDLMVSARFYDAAQGGFHFGHVQGLLYLTEVAGSASVVALAGLIGYWAWGKLRKAPHVPGRLVAYLLLAFLVGPVLTISMGFKEHWGRARPLQITQFGGEAQFTPYWKPSGACESDCSFPSGHSSRGFAWVALAIAAYGFGWRYRRAILFGSLAIGTLAASLRVMEGKHFLSDVTLSGCIVIYLSWVLFRLMYPQKQAH